MVTKYTEEFQHIDGSIFTTSPGIVSIIKTRWQDASATAKVFYSSRMVGKDNWPKLRDLADARLQCFKLLTGYAWCGDVFFIMSDATAWLKGFDVFDDRAVKAMENFVLELIKVQENAPETYKSTEDVPTMNADLVREIADAAMYSLYIPDKQKLADMFPNEPNIYEIALANYAVLGIKKVIKLYAKMLADGDNDDLLLEIFTREAEEKCFNVCNSILKFKD